jgi:pimeloyl-ACP methyl ester carboxylesterase
VDQEVAAVVGSLGRWPVPFASTQAAEEFWGGPSVKSEAWVSGLEDRGDGLWPRFEMDVMERTLRAAICRPRWPEWESLRVPTLIVRGGNGPIAPRHFAEMTRRLPGSRLVEVQNAGHDVHIEAPEQWQATLTDFLESI